MESSESWNRRIIYNIKRNAPKHFRRQLAFINVKSNSCQVHKWLQLSKSQPCMNSMNHNGVTIQYNKH